MIMVLKELELPPDVRESFKTLVHRIEGKELFRGRSRHEAEAVALYLAYKKNNKVRSYVEISRMMDVKKKTLIRLVKVFSKELGIKVEPTKPVDYLERFCYDLGASNEIKERAKGILKTLDLAKSPLVLVATAIYVAGEGQFRQRDIAEIMGVSEMSIRNTIKEQSLQRCRYGSRQK